MANTTYAERNGRKTLTTVQGLPKKFDQKKILKVIKKKFGKFERPRTTENTSFSEHMFANKEHSLQWHYSG